MKKILTIAVLAAALMANAILVRGDDEESQPHTCTVVPADAKPLTQSECDELAKSLDEFYESIRTGKAHIIPARYAADNQSKEGK